MLSFRTRILVRAQQYFSSEQVSGRVQRHGPQHHLLQKERKREMIISYYSDLCLLSPAYKHTNWSKSWFFFFHLWLGRTLAELYTEKLILLKGVLLLEELKQFLHEGVVVERG